MFVESTNLADNQTPKKEMALKANNTSTTWSASKDVSAVLKADGVSHLITPCYNTLQRNALSVLKFRK